jgi:hypothetical protein
MPKAPEIVEVDNTQLEEVPHRVEQALDEKDAELIRAVFASYVYVTDLVEDKNTSIRRLRQLLFGACTEKTDAMVGRRGEKREESPQRDVAANTELAADEADSGVSAEEATETAAQSHGRNGADAYRGAERITVPHPSLRAGDSCPACDLRNRLRKSSRRGGADQPAAAADGDDLPVAKATLQSVRPSVYRRSAARGGQRKVRRHSPQHDRPLEVRQRTPL